MKFLCPVKNNFVSLNYPNAVFDVPTAFENKVFTGRRRELWVTSSERRFYFATMKGIEITYSDGRGKSGQQYAYIRPAGKCRNKSRRCAVQDIQKTIDRYFAPEVKYYEVDGFTIGSNSPDNGLKEYYRICDKRLIGVKFEVKEIDM